MGGVNMKWLQSVQIFKSKLPVRQQKQFDMAIILVSVGVLILLATGEIFGENKNQRTTKSDVTKNIDSKDDVDERLTGRISNILSNIDGAGQVDVLITYERSVERVYAYETRSNQSQGGSDQRKEMDQEQRIAYWEDENGGKVPVLTKEIQPEPKGAIVIADGGGEASVKERLSSAIQVLLKLPPHSIQVFPRSK